MKSWGWMIRRNCATFTRRNFGGRNRELIEPSHIVNETSLGRVPFCHCKNIAVEAGFRLREGRLNNSSLLHQCVDGLLNGETVLRRKNACFPLEKKVRGSTPTQEHSTPCSKYRKQRGSPRPPCWEQTPSNNHLLAVTELQCRIIEGESVDSHCLPPLLPSRGEGVALGERGGKDLLPPGFLPLHLLGERKD